MDFIRSWIIPPLIGAIIGYFTNWLAIKMLFRPYKEIRIGGIKVPFTPGILPRERERLAESLGDTVAQELLTPKVITDRIHSPQIQKTAAKAVSIAIKGFLDQDAERLFLMRHSEQISSEDAEAALEDSAAGSSLAHQIIESLRRLVASADIQTAIQHIFAEFITRLGRLKFQSLVSKQQFVAGIMKAAGSIGSQSVDSDIVHVQSTDSENESGYSRLRPILAALLQLPPDATIRVATDSLVPSAYALFLPELKQFLRSKEFRSRLEVEGRSFVKRALDRLGPVQRLFVSLAGYETRISQSMPETIEDLIKTIELLLDDPEVPERLAEAACATIVSRRAKTGPASTAASMQRENIASAIGQSLKESSDELKLRAERVYDDIADLSLEELAGGRMNAEDISGFVLSAFVRAIDSEKEISSSTIGTLFIDVLKESAKGKTIAEFFGIQEQDIEQISYTLANALLQLIETRMPLLVEAMDIRGMVAERIDSLDMKEVERIVLQVVSHELAWITWLGGILGAMIGFIQSLIALL